MRKLEKKTLYGISLECLWMKTENNLPDSLFAPLFMVSIEKIHSESTINLI